MTRLTLTCILCASMCPALRASAAEQPPNGQAEQIKRYHRKEVRPAGRLGVVRLTVTQHHRGLDQQGRNIKHKAWWHHSLRLGRLSVRIPKRLGRLLEQRLQPSGAPASYHDKETRTVKRFGALRLERTQHHEGLRDQLGPTEHKAWSAHSLRLGPVSVPLPKPIGRWLENRGLDNTE